MEALGTIARMEHTCPRCGAQLGDSCLTPKGRRLFTVHMERLREAVKAGKVGRCLIHGPDAHPDRECIQDWRLTPRAQVEILPAPSLSALVAEDAKDLDALAESVKSGENATPFIGMFVKVLAELDGVSENEARARLAETVKESAEGARSMARALKR